MARRQIAGVLLVPGGVLASHALGYLLAHPEAAERHEALSHHGHLSLLTVLAVPAAATAVVAAALAGRARRKPIVRLRSLALAQTVAFTALEVAEHAASGRGWSAASAEAGLLWGLGLQVVVAWAGVALLRLSAVTGAAPAPLPALCVPLRPSLLPAPAVDLANRRPFASPASGRGPPILVRG